MISPPPPAVRTHLSLEKRSAASRTTSLVFYGVFGLLLFEPLAFGGVESWAIYLLEAGAAMLLMIWAFHEFVSEEVSIRWNPLFPPMLAFASLVILQLVSGMTAYRYVTISSGLLYCAYGVLCFLVVQCLRRTWQIRNLVMGFSAYGLALATFALFQGLISNGKLYWLRAPHGGGWIYGPYVNHNHYAGVMEMLFPIPLVLSLTCHVTGTARRLAVLASAVMAITIFLSGSRAGAVALVCEIVVLLFALMKQKSRVPFRGRLAFGIFLVLSISLLAWIGGSRIPERFSAVSARSELTQGIRLQIDRDLLRLFSQRRIAGWGLGTFATVYPRYKSANLPSYLGEAHNDYLQLLVEAGAAGFIIMIWFLCLLFRHAAKKMRNWPTDINGAATLAAILGIVGILVHSLVDFNLQIPANAAMFYVFCTIAAMEPRFSATHRAL